ncbi:MAG TPA: Dabb family protein [Opitutaceae bacterium]
MLVHSVFFYLKPELTAADRAAFRAGVDSLRTIASVDTAYIGAPAAVPPRPVVDATYDVSITAVFKDVAAHNAYQVDPVHVKFVETYRSYWTRVQIYDAQD